MTTGQIAETRTQGIALQGQQRYALGVNVAGREQALRELDFGKADADSELDLDQKFIATTAFSRFLAPNTLVVSGPKGAGKSALFDMVTKYRNRAQELAPGQLDESLLIAGTQVPYDFAPPSLARFNDALRKGQSLREFWASHLALTAMRAIAHDFDAHSDRHINAELKGSLQDSQAITDTRVPARLRRALSRLGFRLTVVKVTIGPAGLEFGSKKPVEPEDLLANINEYLERNGLRLWIVLDKLDELSQERSKLAPAVVDLVQQGKQITDRFKRRIRSTVLIRSDIWRGLAFASADHFTGRHAEVTWQQEEVLPFLVRRIVQKESVRRHLLAHRVALDDTDVATLGTDDQRSIFYAIFDDCVLGGMKTLPWMLDRLQYGNKQLYPRDVINLCNFARERQQGASNAGPLVLRDAIGRAFTDLSKERRRLYLDALFPDLLAHFRQFNRKTNPRFTRHELLGMFVALHPCGDDAIEQLHIAGVLRGLDNDECAAAQHFEVPSIFRRGLNMNVRGAQ